MDTRPVIFLDIDGVLHTLTSCSAKPPKHFDPRCLKALEDLVTASGARIVVSSTWRLGHKSMVGVAERLAEYGLRIPLDSRTPSLWTQKGELERGWEIDAWLQIESDRHGGKRPPFVILDDDDDMAHLRPFLIQTTFETGLTDADASRALESLKQQQADAGPESPRG